MALSAEELAKREFELLTSPDTIRVRVPVKPFGTFWLPAESGDKAVEAIFKVMSFGDNLVIEKACTYRIDNKQTRERRDEVDINEMRRLIVKRNLLSWSLPIPIERENGWMTAECYQRVGKTPAPLMEAILDKYEERIQVTREDEELIHRQSAVLFSKNSRGVADACEAISLFCTLGNYWEKFGLDRFTILNLPYREYLMLKMMIGKEGEAHKAASTSRAPSSRIAMGHGGRTRPSRAIAQGR
jgi:hypothetical protein